MKKISSTTASDHCLFLSAPSATGAMVDTTDYGSEWKQRKRVTGSPRKSEIEKAVYAHIRAVRALGRTQINTSDVADALSLPVSEINHAIVRLRKKGVRVR